MGVGPPRQRKEVAGRAKFAATMGALLLSRKCFRRTCQCLFRHKSLRTTYGCETQKSALRLASLQGLATGKFCTAGFIYRFSAFAVTDSVYSQTQDTAPTEALLL